VPTIRQSIVTVLVLLAAPLAPLAARQERVGAPPEIRELVEAFTAAVVGGSPETWETMARERFAPEYLAKLPAPERRKLYDQLSADFKGAKRGAVRRQGPDAPLELQMTGPSGPAGTIVLEITDGMPPKITSVTVEKASGKKLEEPSHADQVHGDGR
jgi:hypothetical protein